MDVIEVTRQLGKAVQADARYIEYVRAKEANDADEHLQQLIGEFNLIRQNIAYEQGKPEEEQDADKIRELTVKMHSAYDEIMTNENMAAFNLAKQGLDQLRSEITALARFPPALRAAREAARPAAAAADKRRK